MRLIMDICSCPPIPQNFVEVLTNYYFVYHSPDTIARHQETANRTLVLRVIQICLLHILQPVAVQVVPFHCSKFFFQENSKSKYTSAEILVCIAIMMNVQTRAHPICFQSIRSPLDNQGNIHFICNFTHSYYSIVSYVRIVLIAYINNKKIKTISNYQI